MPPPKRVYRPSHITVGDFFDRHGHGLQMSLVGPEVGFDRKIIEPTINRPGLALSGFYNYFAWKRVQVIGSAERSYLNNLGAVRRRERIDQLCEKKIPCIVISRGKRPPSGLLESAEAAGIAVFSSPMVTMRFVNTATLLLEADFSPSVTEHGCMVDVKGVGILIRGSSGSGKSESVLGLLERGASLVADDMVRFRMEEGELRGRSMSIGSYHMEVRGLGIVDVATLFGVSSVRLSKRLDLVVTLVPMENMNEIDRAGVERKSYDVIGVPVPLVEIPVAPGRDLAGLIEVASLDQKLRSYGHDSASEFSKRLTEQILANNGQTPRS